MRRLSLTRFRSYDQVQIDIPAGPGDSEASAAAGAIVLTGPNGAGKTNLLEALSFLAPGRGLRRASLPDVERIVPGPRDPLVARGWAVAARVETVPDAGGDRMSVQIGTGREPGPVDGSDRRVVRIDGAPARSQSALADYLHVTWLTPDMDRIFAGPAGDRRRFFDRLVYGFVPDHASRLAAYEKQMRERSRLLKEGRFDDAWLGALEQGMAEAGIAVAAARRDLLGQLAASLAEQEAAAFPVPEIAIAGETEALLAEGGPALAAEDALRETLAANRRLDAEAGRALFGPHRADLIVTYRAKGMPAADCSTGEQKALLIALVLAAARLRRALRGAAPLLLLDEVAAHLDENRRAALFDTVLALGGQAWMTGTDAALFRALGQRATYLSVAGGQVTREAPPPGAP